MRELVKRGAREGQLATGNVRELLVFTLAGELYAVELSRIREILTPPPITRVPRAAADVLGVCSVRGLLVTVVDLRRRLRVSAQRDTRRTRILLAQAPNDEVVGLVVDEVKNVVRLGEAEVELAVGVLGGEVSEHVMGIGRPQHGPVIVLLDIRSLVSSGKES
ncbi:MAG: chemotaxis protein CheW [Polyangiaceae bacterium]